MKPKLSLILYLGILFLSSSCHYHHDKLIIVNNTNDTICYNALTKDKKDGQFYSVAGGSKVNPHEISSPPVRGTIEFNLQDRNADSHLYLIYFRTNDSKKVYKNLDQAAKSGKYKIESYSVEELNKQRWIVTYGE